MKAILRIAVLVAIVTGLGTIVHAQQTAKIARVGFLTASDPKTLASRLESFRQGLRDLGYFEGKNMVLEIRWAEGKRERLPLLAAELERMKMDVIVTGGPSATRGAKQGTSRTPIVMALDGDPVGSGFVASLARPGGNITGLSILSPEVSAKQIDILRQVMPGLARVSVLGDSNEPGNGRALQETERAARMAGLQIHYVDRRAAQELDDAFQAMRKERAEAVVVLPTPMSTAERARVAALASIHRLPAIYPWPDFVDVGGLLTYSVNIEDLYRRAASYVDKILKGSKPADLPVEQPYKFELVINLRAAKEIGLVIPTSVLTRADRVVQ